MANFTDQNYYKGHLEIYKQYDDLTEESIYSSKNIIVSGLGTGLSYLFAGDGASSIINYNLTYYQLGVSGSQANLVSSTSELVGPLTIQEYGNSSLFRVLTQSTDGILKKNKVFGLILANNIRIKNDTTIQFQIVLDKTAGNKILRDNQRLPINEIGLFMKSPFDNSAEDIPILSAYRVFDNIFKSSTFNLIFRWDITKL